MTIKERLLIEQNNKLLLETKVQLQSFTSVLKKFLEALYNKFGLTIEVEVEKDEEEK